MKRRISGIYAIVNVWNGDRYIGSSVDIADRWKDHQSDLRGNKHDNPHLQAAWNKYGEAAFDFVILERCVVSDLKDHEQMHLDADPEYNIAKFATSPMRGRHHSEATMRRLMAFYAKRRQDRNKWMAEHPGEKPPPVFVFPPQSEETKRKRAESHRGKKRSDETRQRMSNAQKGLARPYARKPRSAEDRQRISAGWARRRAEKDQWVLDHPGEELPPHLKRKGVSPTPETRQKIAQAQRGKPRPYVREMMDRKWEERIQWIRDHPGEEPPPYQWYRAAE